MKTNVQYRCLDVTMSVRSRLHVQQYVIIVATPPCYTGTGGQFESAIQALDWALGD
jgi:hypothetical protein